MKPQISVDDFKKVDIRVGEVLDVTDVTDADKLLKLTVDFGPEIGTKTVFSGIKKYREPQDLVGKKFAFIINLTPREFKFGISEAMILAALDGEDLGICTFDQDLPAGSMVR